ncbi:hypothetical protein [Plantibacter cousiniae (nom. nud.)]|uniref:GyrI-like small molecule binding domain-containing protein n=1 Tax=Plantibacter cousiniae (nom. nud.) TaxID=199709 RepID=A0ABY1LPT2_9MICO|nr:hypothetical protein [Plantibacter cousiniae]SKC70573.1 hypothetical protein SAMN06295973_3185 [Plantibacter cousiniae]
MTAPTPSVITVRLDGVDLDRWIWVPHAWPYEGFTDPRGWADAAAKGVARRSGFAFVKRAALRDDLIEMSRSRDSIGAHWTVAYAPDLSRPARIARIEVHDSRVGTYRSLEQFMQLDTPGLEGPPVVEPFVSPHLGEGITAIMHQRNVDRTLSAVRSYGWTLPTCWVSMYYADFDLGLMERLRPEFDALARALQVDEQVVDS